jgi:hypothetical protein
MLELAVVGSHLRQQQEQQAHVTHDTSEARGQLRNFFNACCCDIYGGWQSTSNNSKMHTKQVSGQFVHVWCCRLVVVFV